MEDVNDSSATHDGRGARGLEGAESHVGIQHGSAAGSDLPAESVPTAPPVDLAAATRPLVGPPLVNLAAVTNAAVNFGTSPTTRRRASETGSPLLDAFRRRHAQGEHTPSLVQGGRAHSRSPRPVTPPTRASAVPPGSAPPASPDWRQDIPGHDTTVEELRGFVLREIGQLHANARTQAERSYEARIEIEIPRRRWQAKLTSTWSSPPSTRSMPSLRPRSA